MLLPFHDLERRALPRPLHPRTRPSEDAIQARAWGLADTLRGYLADVPGAIIRDLGTTRSAIVSFTVEGMDAEETVAELQTRRIMIGTSDPESTRLDAEARQLPMLMRAAPHYYNTEAELERLVETLMSLRRTS